jgi:hypothetical protein
MVSRDRTQLPPKFDVLLITCVPEPDYQGRPTSNVIQRNVVRIAHPCVVPSEARSRAIDMNSRPEQVSRSEEAKDSVGIEGNCVPDGSETNECLFFIKRRCYRSTKMSFQEGSIIEIIQTMQAFDGSNQYYSN